MRIAVIAALIILILLALGTMDFADAMAEQARYCRMVEAGAWPDYRGSYEAVCLGRAAP